MDFINSLDKMLKVIFPLGSSLYQVQERSCPRTTKRLYKNLEYKSRGKIE